MFGDLNTLLRDSEKQVGGRASISKMIVIISSPSDTGSSCVLLLQVADSQPRTSFLAAGPRRHAICKIDTRGDCCPDTTFLVVMGFHSASNAMARAFFRYWSAAVNFDSVSTNTYLQPWTGRLQKSLIFLMGACGSIAVHRGVAIVFVR